ncbi:MAG: hypothetical protein C0594_07040 [Marinilabiliales bacterium]|nr:MAG: hypothetical protein C0594_07040 [Marinilabiliales bacterium]
MRSISFLFLVICFSMYSFGHDDNWKMSKNESGIVVHTKNNSSSRIKEVKASAIMNCEISEITAAILDVSKYTNWVYECSVSNLIRENSKIDKVYYLVTNVPWPVSDRDMVFHIKAGINKNNHSVEITAVTLKDEIPEKEGMVRVNYSMIKWEIKQIQPGKIELLYWLKGDPGGEYPDWILEMFMVSGPFNSIKALKTIVEKGNYKQNEIDEILDW